ncbi:MAG: hypothetical protein CM15mP74_16210 [Halieaceae bacterium]|nr:MAG: hypothetical protein CM15mP74_16210 [Halieaceae bacterium]
MVCALLHDIGDTLGPANHADVAAVLLEPYVSEANHWMVKHHGIFQGYYFFTIWVWIVTCAISTKTTPTMSAHSSLSRSMMLLPSIPTPNTSNCHFSSL